MIEVSEIRILRKRLLLRRRIKGECWIWTGAKIKGYGTIKRLRSRRNISVPRLAFVIWKNSGKLPTNFVLHSCDVKECFRPKHLHEGTNKLNVLEAKQRNHYLIGLRNPRGRAKLSWELVAKIRSSEESALVLSRRYNIGRSSISRIRTGATWNV